jgi:hypothetical protein
MSQNTHYPVAAKARLRDEEWYREAQARRLAGRARGTRPGWPSQIRRRLACRLGSLLAGTAWEVEPCSSHGARAQERQAGALSE